MSASEPIQKSTNWRDWIPSCIYGAIIVIQAALTFHYYNHLGLDAVANAGWLVLTVSGIFGWMPIYTFRRKGGVPKGDSYMRTTILVDSGIYSIVRHPQYLAGILISIALALLSQHWLNVVLVVPVVVGTYIDSLRADTRLIDKFGDEYVGYKQRVPGLNALLGMLRLSGSDAGLRRRVMPTTYFIAFLALSISSHFLCPIKRFIHPPHTYAGLILILLGVALNLWTDRLFREVNTTVKPYLEPTSLITSGPFSLSRHPMYLGMASILLGVAVNQGTVITFVFPALFMLSMETLFIPYEEETLLNVYGDEYRKYQEKVRRWL